MENKKKIAPFVIAAMVMIMTALAAFSMPVSAQGEPGAGCVAETQFYNASIHGDIYLEQDGWAEFSPMTKTFEVPSETIKVARVYTGFWQGSPGKGGFFNITINNTGGSHTSDTYKACDPCPQATGCAPWQPGRCDALNNDTNMPYNADKDLVNMHDYIVGCGVQFVSFNATPYITPGSNTITVRTEPCATCARGGWDGRIYVIALLVVYENETMPVMTYWVNEGALYLETGSDCDGPTDHTYASKYFNGTNVSNPTKVKLWSLGWPHVINATESPAYTELNDHNIGYPDITEDHAGYEVLLRWNDISTSYLSPSSNLLEYSDPAASYERAFAEVLMVQGTTGPDLEVTNIQFPTVMRPNTDYTVTATVANYGDANAGPFNVSLEVEREGTTYYNREVNVSGGLNAGASTPVDFTDVNLTAGCYNFTVTADCNNNVSEGNEYNNEETAKRQVGNYIVVRSNSDFDTLVSDGFATNVSGTYYIKDLDIENCAGRGIDIQNTNVPFVITNCTVHDCLYCGIYFHSVTNGKVNDSEVRTCELKGIRMMNTSYVTIDNNYVHDNQKYGIDVYPETMPNVDCEYINITNNTIQENLYGIELIGSNCTVKDNNITNNTATGNEGYGIYVFGNDSTICNNNISYNDNYGIYLDNATAHPCFDNSIYNNTFIDNNVKFSEHESQGYDSGTTNAWNSTEKGNWWSDWLNNNGFPNTYEIDGGTNEDKDPKGLYDFSTGEGTDKWAFKKQVDALKPDTNNVPNTLFDAAQYDDIKVNDGDMEVACTDAVGKYAVHRFNFSISEDPNDISKINVTWNGIGENDGSGQTKQGATLYIWNGTGYDELGNNSDANEVTLTGQITTNIGNYINADNVTVLVVQNDDEPSGPKHSYIKTDYVRVIVTP